MINLIFVCKNTVKDDGDFEPTSITFVDRVDGVTATFECLVVLVETLHGSGIVRDIMSVWVWRVSKAFDGCSGRTGGVHGVRFVLLWIVRRESGLGQDTDNADGLACSGGHRDVKFSFSHVGWRW